MSNTVYGLLVILTTALMGSSFAIGKWGLVYSSPLLLVAFRFTLAGIIMTITVRLLKRPHPVKVNHWIQMAVIGFFQTAGVMGCIFVGLRTITSGETSILTFMNPLLVVVFGTIFVKSKYYFLQWVGVVLGFIGVFITLGTHLEFKAGTWLGFMSAVSWSIATLLVKKWGQRLDTWVLTAYQMLFGGLILLLSSILLEKAFFMITFHSLSILLWLAIMSSIVQFALWYYLLQKGDPGKTSAFLFLAPFFGVISGWLLLGEQIQWYVAAGGFFIFIGIFLVNWKAGHMRKSRRRIS